MHHACQFVGRGQHQRVTMAVGGDRSRQRRLVDAFDRLLRQPHRRRRRWTVSASLKQVAKASNREASRVKRCGCTIAITLASVAARAALNTAAISTGMVAIVVVDGDAVPCPREGEASADAAKSGDRLADDVDRRAKFVRDRDRRRGVERVVAARHRQREVIDEGGAARRPIPDQHRKSRDAPGEVHVHKAHIGLRDFPRRSESGGLRPGRRVPARSDGRGT